MRLRQRSELPINSCLALELLHQSQLLDFQAFVHHVDCLNRFELFIPLLDYHRLRDNRTLLSESLLLFVHLKINLLL